MMNQESAEAPKAGPGGDVDGPPTLSVVVPCRNERLHIEETMRSILGQQAVEGGFEVLVVDGQSDDGTRVVLKRLQEAGGALRVVDNPERITAAAMNRGVELSRGKLVAILGAHSLYAPDYLQTCVDLLSEHPEADCVGGTIESSGQSVFGKAVAFAMSHPAGVGNARHRYPDYEGYAEGACFPMFRREALLRTGLYDTTLVRNQDDDLNYRFRQAGGRVFISHRAKCVYYVRETAKALFQQYHQYGVWRLKVLRKHGDVASWRQLAPVAFFAWLALSFLLCIVAPAWRGLWLAPLFAYAVMLLSTTLLSASSVGWAAAWRVPWAMVTMHFAYALGFATTFFKKPGS
jgi:succinoglycan biosynthesis protein ExoA